MSVRIVKNGPQMWVGPIPDFAKPWWARRWALVAYVSLAFGAVCGLIANLYVGG